MAEEKKEKTATKGRYVASVAVYDSSLDKEEGLEIKQFDEIFASESAAQHDIYNWVVKEYFSKRDIREMLRHYEDDEQDPDGYDDIDTLAEWAKRERSVYIKYEIEDLDD